MESSEGSVGKSEAGSAVRLEHGGTPSVAGEQPSPEGVRGRGNERPWARKQ